MCPYSYLWWRASPYQELWQRVSFNGNRNESQASTARTFKRPVLQHGTSIHRFPVYQIRAQRCSHMACRLLRHRWRRWGWDTRWRLMGMWRRQTAPGRTLFLCNYTTLNPLFDDLFASPCQNLPSYLGTLSKKGVTVMSEYSTFDHSAPPATASPGLPVEGFF